VLCGGLGGVQAIRRRRKAKDRVADSSSFPLLREPVGTAVIAR